MNEIHIPVLWSEVLQYLAPKSGESYLDLTAGYGGHADKILEVTQNYNEAVLNDRDQNAIEFLKAKYQKVKLEIRHDDFYNTALQLVENEKKFDLILADLGVSSPQLDRGERGFAFSKDARLDMRMDQRQNLDAWSIVNSWSERRLREIFVQYAEASEGRAAVWARAIVSARPVETTAELAEVIRRTTGHYERTHPATKVFQAIRIVVNDELGLLERSLPLIVKLLKPGGRVGIISFHSLEDRIVKDFFREESSLGLESRLEVVTKKAIVAEKTELANNPRARSAKLRVARRR
ncbi:16S rRNA (cytosine(1402)-N(4))-methyltransferase RsmH [Candidatus Saccharibacteria bacterium]|nr:16S rRNA (cytosine(1402)-N(4))-methyltransferase RsmH [Candidatus Saccharibacteria bacterium]